MAITKIVDDVRTTTALEAAKVTTGTLPEARISSLDSTKLTGTIASARISEASVVQHSPPPDLTSIKQDILILALSTAVDNNKVAHNLPNAFIDQFEGETGLATQTTVDRDTSGEYVSSVAAGAYPIDAYDKLILHSDEAHNSVTFTNSAIGGQAITPNNNVRHRSHANIPIGAKFNGSAIFFDGTTDFLSLPSHADWTFGTGDFTIDFWYYQTDNADRCIVGNSSTGSPSPNVWRCKSAATLKFGTSYNDRFTGPTTLGQSAWRHCAYTVASQVLRVFLDGTQEGSNTAFTDNLSDTRALYIGEAHDGGDLHGYIDEMRISKGIARWTSNFTPPTEPYGTSTVSAAGTLVSTVQTAPATVSEMSGVIIYTDGGSGAATLGTGGSDHLAIYFTANLQGTSPSWTGTNWTPVSGYGTAQTFSGSKKMVKLAKTTITNTGTACAMKAVWANQAQTTMETRLDGWAMNY